MKTSTPYNKYWLLMLFLLCGYLSVSCTTSSRVKQAVADEPVAGQVSKPTTCLIDVAGMTCATCPIQVRKAMFRVDGVQEVNVSFKNKLATVQYDAAKASPEKIAAAATEIGYPSMPRSE